MNRAWGDHAGSELCEDIPVVRLSTVGVALDVVNDGRDPDGCKLIRVVAKEAMVNLWVRARRRMTRSTSAIVGRIGEENKADTYHRNQDLGCKVAAQLGKEHA